MSDEDIKYEKGIKYDEGKLRVAEFLTDFEPVLEPLVRIWEFGANTYGVSNWKQVENGKVRFTNAMLRHFLKESHRFKDTETGLPHAAHVAFNALMRLYFILQEPVCVGDDDKCVSKEKAEL